MWELTKKILKDQRGFFRSASYTPPPAEPLEDESAADEAAAREREAMKKKRRPTMLTGAYGVPGRSEERRVGKECSC